MENLRLLHPAIIHFPIVLILFTVALESMGLLLRRDNLRKMAEYGLILSTAFAILGVISGYIASDVLGHQAPGHDLVHQHRNIMLWMLAALGLSLIWFLIARWKKINALRNTLLLPLLITTALLFYGADKGARMVYEHGIGTIPMMKDAKSTEHLPADLNENSDHD